MKSPTAIRANPEGSEQMTQEHPAAHPGSYADPFATLFIREGRVLRALKPDAAEFYTGLLNLPVVREMLGTRIVETAVVSDTIDGFGAVLEHRMISPVSYCYEWAPPMLRDAALLHLDILRDLAPAHLVLQDAYPWNILFDGAKPLFVDFTSIIREERDLLWIAYSQFNQFFVWPLRLTSMGMGDVVRSLLHDYIQGVTADQFVRLMPASGFLRSPKLLWEVYLPLLLAKRSERRTKNSRLVEMASRFSPSTEMRKRFFGSLRSAISGLNVEARSTQWARYYEDITAFDAPETYPRKAVAVASLLGTLRPRTVVDLGCNQGGYSIIAADAGARVISLDTDETSISMLYRHARERNLPITPLIVDVMNPSPAGGWRTKQFAPAHERFRGECVLALAVVHHLALTQRQSFERIASTFSDYTETTLITEFVSIEDERSRMIQRTNRRDVTWYTLDNFIGALRRHFRRIEQIPSIPETRTILVCTR